MHIYNNSEICWEGAQFHGIISIISSIIFIFMASIITLINFEYKRGIDPTARFSAIANFYFIISESIIIIVLNFLT